MSKKDTVTLTEALLALRDLSAEVVAACPVADCEVCAASVPAAA